MLHSRELASEQIRIYSRGRREERVDLLCSIAKRPSVARHRFNARRSRCPCDLQNPQAESPVDPTGELHSTPGVAALGRSGAYVHVYIVVHDRASDDRPVVRCLKCRPRTSSECISVQAWLSCSTVSCCGRLCNVNEQAQSFPHNPRALV